DGYEATRCIRALADPVLASIPIIAMTANAFDEDKRRAFACGMNGFISKPIVIEEVLQALRGVFGG
ncbi:MAG: response regulator, partial [Lachnospiraceae bacterium]|nr:response regulator [bacterium]MDY5516822.1 response regulator [Lachnospiraceae bacterium]